jgi:hypothetical protein
VKFPHLLREAAAFHGTLEKQAPVVPSAQPAQCPLAHADCTGHHPLLVPRGKTRHRNIFSETDESLLIFKHFGLFWLYQVSI